MGRRLWRALLLLLQDGGVTLPEELVQVGPDFTCKWV
jgi:hypothetical protein